MGKISDKILDKYDPFTGRDPERPYSEWSQEELQKTAPKLRTMARNYVVPGGISAGIGYGFTCVSIVKGWPESITVGSLVTTAIGFTGLLVWSSAKTNADAIQEVLNSRSSEHLTSQNLGAVTLINFDHQERAYE